MHESVAPHAAASAAPFAAPTRGRGLGWERVAAAVAERVTPESIDGIWLFAPVRQEDREWGTAVISCRIADDRRRLYTASYIVAARGRERGHGRVQIEAVGDTPDVVVRDVIAGVQARAGDSEPPTELVPHDWFPPSSATHDSGSESIEPSPSTTADEVVSP